MKKKVLWALLAVVLVAAVILAIVLPRNDRAEKAAENGEAQTPAVQQEESASDADPSADIVLEDDELPLDVP